MPLNAIAVWDFTLWDKSEELDHEDVIEFLKEFSKKWCFQAENAGSGKHYQGRISRKVKSRSMPPIDFGIQWRLTSGESSGNDFYVCKDESRIAGPWRDTDMYIPRQVLEVKELFSWQNSVIEISKKWDSRHINVIIDEPGCKGKSILVAKMCCEMQMARRVPALNNFKELMNIVYCMPVSRCYLIDMPKAMDKSKQQEFFSAVEDIKNGHIWDNRYTYKEKWIDSPVIWLFTNVPPNRRFLSADRWQFFSITAERDLKALRCNTIL